MADIKDGGAVPTKPETAYELLELVAQHIEEEPRRYYQEAWVLRGEEIRVKALTASATSCANTKPISKARKLADVPHV